MNDIVKVNLIALSSVGISFTNVSKILELSVLLLSIIFTFYKFYKNNKDN